jgi:hypothetical protein
LVYKFQNRNLIQQFEESPAGAEANKTPLYFIQSIRKHKDTSKGRLYLIKWLSYPENQCTWEPGSGLVGFRIYFVLPHLNNTIQPPSAIEKYEATLL